MDSFKIFIDESGTHALDTSKSGVSNLFVLTAIIIKDSDLNFVNSELDKFAQENCSGAELKSSRIAGNSAKRVEWLKSISSLPFKFISFIINKKKLSQTSSPLRFKQVFYKWANRQLMTNLSNFFNADVFADETGGVNFKDSFVNYIKDQIGDLFKNFNIALVNSKNYRGVQLADIVSGSLSYVFDSEKKDDFSEEIWNILKEKCLNIKACPKIKRDSQIFEISNQVDLEELEDKCIEKAFSIIERKLLSSDEVEQMQGIVLDELLTAKTSGKSESIFADTLVDILKRNGYELINKNFLTTGIIAKLRDEGIVIAGNNDGYTLAISPKDFKIFTEHNNGIILPMLERLNTARNTISNYTNKEYDILGFHEQLKKLVDFYVEEKLKINLDTTPEEITAKNIGHDG